ncbi:Uma2 family endonuclease, partial [Pedobacter borealis]|uniref:Uma2 family endonuclease n=1 Tax=Pedobacter borealis TaxID=475254 RepID=UPI00068D1F8A
MKNIKPYPTEEEQPPIKTLNEVDFSAVYSYADYMRFEFEERLEIIKGYIFKMSPAPSRIHQKISGRIYVPIYNALNGHKCEVYSAPFDVRLAKKTQDDKEVFTVVQPDIVVVCDPSKLDKRGCIGAPDIVVEILSPGNNKKELINKYEVYEEAGVKEYWIVSPSEKTFF